MVAIAIAASSEVVVVVVSSGFVVVGSFSNHRSSRIVVKMRRRFRSQRMKVFSPIDHFLSIYIAHQTPRGPRPCRCAIKTTTTGVAESAFSSISRFIGGVSGSLSFVVVVVVFVVVVVAVSATQIQVSIGFRSTLLAEILPSIPAARRGMPFPGVVSAAAAVGDIGATHGLSPCFCLLFV